jgi:2',3'-cyclic-nucleotide 2'-phosphodiesterase (5'-nucleotidase family)
LFFLALSGALVLSSCAGLPPKPAAPAETRIVIFHSNDVHGKIDNFAKVAAIIDSERKNRSEVFFFSAGDNYSGDPVIDMYDPPGKPMLELLVRMGLNVMTPGNHEFDYQMGPLRRLAARIPTVSANIEPQPGVFPELRPWAVLKTRDGTKIVVFGLIQTEPDTGLPSTHPDKIRGLRFSEPLAKALEMKKLRASGEVLIGLTHIGYEQDLLLAKEMPELDVIIGGHSHTRVDPPENVNGVLIVQAASDGFFLGRIDLLIKNGRVVEKKARLIDLGQVLYEDRTVKSMIAKFHRNPALARVIAKAPLEITDKGALGSLMTDAIRHAHGLDIAFQNNGGIRLKRLPLDITLNDVYTLEPFGNQIIEFVMTADEIRSLIKSSWEKRRDIDLQVSGITYIVRTDSAREIKEIKLRNPDGSPLDEERTYTVGVSSYIASSYKFAHQDPGRSLQTTTAQDLIRYLESGIDLSIYRELQRAFWENADESSRD